MFFQCIVYQLYINNIPNISTIPQIYQLYINYTSIISQDLDIRGAQHRTVASTVSVVSVAGPGSGTSVGSLSPSPGGAPPMGGRPLIKAIYGSK